MKPRYIDANKLLKKAIPMSWSVQKWVSEVMISEVPTESVREDVRGNWTPEQEDWRGQIVWHICSVCGFDASTTYKFCPNCGAKMKGD